MITVYSTATCVYCRQVEMYLKKMGVKYEKVMLDNSPELRQLLYEKTGAMTVPITTDGERYVIGFNIAKIKELFS